jgi:NADH-quinone oxidoreductase subunit J
VTSLTLNSLALAASHMSTAETVGFWILAPIALLGALGVIFARSAVHAGLLLGLVMLSLGVVYGVQDAQFLMFVQLIVYAGAVMSLFLFVLMLVGIDSSDSLVETLRAQRPLALLLGLGFAVLLVAGIADATTGTTSAGLEEANADGNVLGLAKLLFTRYVFAFELTSALLITAALGAMVLTHREKIGPKLTQKMMMQERVRGGRPSPLPGPGVFARSNAVGTPALLPDGTAASESVSPSVAQTLAGRGVESVVGRHPATIDAQPAPVEPESFEAESFQPETFEAEPFEWAPSSPESPPEPEPATTEEDA